MQVVGSETTESVGARNAGLALVETRYAVVLDADDRLAPGALDAMRAPLDADAKLGFAYGWMRFFGAWDGILRFPPYDPYRLLHRHTIGLSALVRRELFEDTGGFDPAFEQYEDWELWLNALAQGLARAAAWSGDARVPASPGSVEAGRGSAPLPAQLRRAAAQARGALLPRRRASPRGPGRSSSARAVPLVLGRAARACRFGGLCPPADLRPPDLRDG